MRQFSMSILIATPNADGSITTPASGGTLDAPTTSTIYIQVNHAGYFLHHAGPAVVPYASTLENTPVSVGVDEGKDATNLSATPFNVPAIDWTLGTPSQGNVSFNANGSLTYTPNPGFVGEDTFTLAYSMNYGGNPSGTLQMPTETATAPGTVKFVQLVSALATDVVAGVTNTHWDTGGTYELDNTYQMNMKTSSAGGILTTYASDDPYLTFYSGITEYNVSMQFETWLMWTPPGDDVIDVPLQEFTWSWSADAKPSGLVSGSPDKPVPVHGTDTNQFPEWTATFVNT
jgi:hypothetical protein